jgi:hypothetical protein
MNYCTNHPETPAVAYCRTCGKPMCDECKRTAQGVIFCDEHVPAAAAQPPVAALPPPVGGAPAADVSPGLACLLGFIPGVGAIYNGQYAKGLVHAVIFGLIISIMNSGAARHMEPVFGILLVAFIFYMAFEAYHTARKRRAGEPVDEFSSIVDLRGRPGTFPIGALVLIALGVILLLDTMDILRFGEIARYWPVLLILLGVWKLYARVAEDGREVRDERH